MNRILCDNLRVKAWVKITKSLILRHLYRSYATSGWVFPTRTNAKALQILINKTLHIIGEKCVCIREILQLILIHCKNCKN